MKELIASHTCTAYLKPGEVIVARKPLLVSTVLGSCIAVTMYSRLHRVGAICHAMLPDGGVGNEDLRYVDTAIHHIYRKVVEYGAGSELEVKLFGGARVLTVGDYSSTKLTVGEQNIAHAQKVLGLLGLKITASDTGGLRGRKLFFCTRDGGVYIRMMRRGKDISDQEMAI
ncbi:chemotaxis protein CheD [Pelotalea chapellei]|uniref:Probable chemoreceptor glutamine deamidase CheD n=1 Tax=Pelotalea chapellei TaxID=44671 RepID=A0ABS5UAR7_9BACT|nr:chemotaxis protein CheD [Pelotalea chapellei]MBT1072759.1 chemotaxis protein CheD [Pelotalea chapellei]